MKKKNEEQYRYLFENNPHPMWVYDLDDLAFLAVNNAAIEHYGYSREEFLGMTIKDIHPSDIHSALIETVRGLVGVYRKPGIWRQKKKNGTLIDVEIITHDISFKGKKARLVLANDVTERKQAEEWSDYQAHLLANVSDAIVASDARFNLLYWNKAAVAIYGWTADEVIGRPEHEVLRSEFIGLDHEEALRRLTGTGQLECELIQYRKDGTQIRVECKTMVLGDEDGHITGYVSVNRDITERKQMEKRVRESEKKFRDLFNSTMDGIYQTDKEGVFTLVNPACARIFRHESVEDLIGKRAVDYWVDLEERKAYLDELKRNKSVSAYLVRGKRRNGEVAYVEISSHILEDGDGNFLGTEGILRDVTERKKLEDEILLTKQDWEETFNTITDMITVHDKDFNIIRANKAAEKILGLPLLKLDETAGAKCFKYYHGAEKPPEGCPSCDCLRTGIAATFELFEPHLNMFIEIRAIPRFDSSNQLIGLIHVVRDITERKRREEESYKLNAAISKAKKEWEMTFDSVSEFIALVDKDFTIVRCNKSFADFVGRPPGELTGSEFYDLFPWGPEETEYYSEKLRKEEPTEWIEIKTKDDRWFYVSLRPIVDEKGHFIHSVVIAADITAIKSAQRRLEESERELRKRVQDLERFYEMAVGRELKMKEIKKEVARLNAELSQYKKKEGEDLK